MRLPTASEFQLSHLSQFEGWIHLPEPQSTIIVFKIPPRPKLIGAFFCKNLEALRTAHLILFLKKMCKKKHQQVQRRSLDSEFRSWTKVFQHL